MAARLSPKPVVDTAVQARIRGVVLAHARALGFPDVPAWLREAWLGTVPERVPSWMAKPFAEPAAEPLGFPSRALAS